MLISFRCWIRKRHFYQFYRSRLSIFVLCNSNPKLFIGKELSEYTTAPVRISCYMGASYELLYILFADEFSRVFANGSRSNGTWRTVITRAIVSAFSKTASYVSRWVYSGSFFLSHIFGQMGKWILASFPYFIKPVLVPMSMFLPPFVKSGRQFGECLWEFAELK